MGMTNDEAQVPNQAQNTNGKTRRMPLHEITHEVEIATLRHVGARNDKVGAFDFGGIPGTPQCKPRQPLLQASKKMR